jgi:hypothetical protein
VNSKKIIPMPMYEWKEELIKKGTKMSFSVDTFESIYTKQEQIQIKTKRLNELREILTEKLKEKENYFKHVSIC